MLLPSEAGSGLYSGPKSSRKISCSVDNVREVVLRVPEGTQAPVFLPPLTAPRNPPPQELHYALQLVFMPILVPSRSPMYLYDFGTSSWLLPTLVNERSLNSNL